MSLILSKVGEEVTIKKITGKDFKFYEVDLLDKDGLEKVFQI